MNFYDCLLTVIILISLITGQVLLMITKRKQPDVLTVLFHILPSVLCILHYLIHGFNYVSVPLYLASLILILKLLSRRRKVISLLIAILTLLISLVPSGFFLYMNQNVAPLKDIAASSYIKSFQALHNEIEESYPLALHKMVDYDKKYEEYLPYFKKAEHDKSKKEYYTALLQYIKSYDDNHFSVINIKSYVGLDDPLLKKLQYENIGGSYGFTISELDNGKIIVNFVKTAGSAEKAGLHQGTEITSWNGIPIKDALSQESTLWNYKVSGCASIEQIHHYQLFLLPRGPVGKKSEIGFINDAGIQQTVTLTSEDDQMDLFMHDLDIIYRCFDDKENLSSKIIDGTHGYILLREMPYDKKGLYYEQFKEALEGFKKNGVQDIIIDARSNHGGYDEFGAHIIELLAKEKTFYLQELTYSKKSGEFTPYRDALVSKASPIAPDIPVTILVNNQTVSAGEGFVYNARKQGNIKVAGMTGTNGSFGTIIGANLMPDNYIVIFPQLACVDEEGNIMIDTDSSMNGGIAPDIRIPVDETAIKRLYTDHADYELEYIMDYDQQ